MDTRGASGRLAKICLAVAIALGFALRIREYAFNRSLWLDEALVGNDILNTGFRGLLKPLGDLQAAPVGWLWLERATMHVFGTSEASLRLWPFLTSLALVVVTPIVARRVLSMWATVVATLLVAVSPQLVYYSSELKPYGGDALCVLLAVLLLTTDSLWHERGSAALAGVALAALSWFSFPTIFVAAAGLLVLVAVRLYDHRANLRAAVPALVPAVVAGLVVLAGDVVQYVVSLRALEKNHVLEEYWRLKGGFPPAHDNAARFVPWLWRQPARVLGTPGQLRVTTLALLLVVAGAVTIALSTPRRRRSLAVLLAAPVAGIAFAAASRYPFAMRVALWSIPIALILLCGLLDLRVPGRYSTALLAVPIVIVSASFVGRGVTVFATPMRNDDARGAYAFVAQHDEPGDKVLFEGFARPTWDYYAPRYHLAKAGAFDVVPGKAGAVCATPAALRSPPPNNRVWIMFNHHLTTQPANSRSTYLDYFRQFGRVAASWSGYGGSAAFLLVLDVPPPATVVQPQWWVEHGCPTVSS